MQWRGGHAAQDGHELALHAHGPPALPHLRTPARRGLPLALLDALGRLRAVAERHKVGSEAEAVKR